MSPPSEIEVLVSVLGRWWEDPTLTGVNRLPARALTTAHPDADTARGGTTPWVHDLGGPWGFTLVDRPESAPAGWATAPVDDRHTIEVPGNWTMQGTGDLPHYTNYVMPFPGEPPTVPAKNPTGLYRRDFVRPRGWARRRTILHLGGAESTAAVWCNGTFVGLTTDTRLPTELDITEHVGPGTNQLAVMVIRWSSAMWIEDQDHWWHAGLYRTVELHSRARTSLGDVRVSATLDRDLATGVLDVAARVDGPSAGWKVDTVLETLGGRRIGGTATSAPVSVFDDSSHLAAMADTYRHRGPYADTTVRTAKISPWSHEVPNRYRVLVSLVDPDGNVTEVVPVVVGFRRVEIVDAELLLNGVALLIAGVNRHDHHPERGKAMTAVEMRADVLNIKRCGFNAVRTSHYPPDPMVLDVCDEIGLWVICEANLESHGRWREVVEDARFETAFVERVQRMVRFHHNHPSIMSWSLGNESGHGPAHHAAAAWVRAADPTRFVHYEGGLREWWHGVEGSRPDAATTDIECPMYPSVDAIVAWATTETPPRPLVMCEYSHAMGNSNGGLADYWAAIETHHGLQGGFIWDWRDQGLSVTDAHGTHYYAYGGAFGDEPNDASFCCNGIVGPDGTPHPALEEHRWLTRPVRTGFVDGRSPRLRIENRRAYSTLDDLVARVTLDIDGVTTWSTRVTVPGCAPGTTAEIPLDLPEPGPGVEGFVTVCWTTRRATDWAERGSLVAWDQTAIDVKPADGPATMAAPVAVRTGPTSSIISVNGVTCVVDNRSGLLVGVESDGRALLSAPPQLAIWRAPVENDGVLVGPGLGHSGVTARWLRQGLDRLANQVVGAEVTTRASTLRARSHHRWVNDAGVAIDHRQELVVGADGAVRFTETVDIPDGLDDIPRVGVAFALAGGLDHLRWLGPGPWETYPDRHAAPVGIWSSSVTDQYVPYVTPQHHGSHVNTRWAELRDDATGATVRLGLDGLTFDASHLRVDDLTRAATTNLLEPTPEVHVHVDAALRGVGTGACGPDTTEIVGAGRYRFAWSLAARSS